VVAVSFKIFGLSPKIHNLLSGLCVFYLNKNP
jgi:hypothetical protein